MAEYILEGQARLGAPWRELQRTTERREAMDLFEGGRRRWPDCTRFRIIDGRGEVVFETFADQ